MIFGDYICLAGMYPEGGIPGCLEVSIGNEQMPKAFLDEVGMQAQLSELRKLSGRAAGWFLPHDVVVRYPGVNELGCDVFRPKRDVILCHASSKGPIDMSEVESARAESIEQHRWTLKRDENQLIVCDPFGRVVALRWTPNAGYRMFQFVAERIERRNPCKRFEDSGFKVATAWFAMEIGHTAMIQGDGSWKDYRRANAISIEAFKCRYDIGPVQSGLKLLQVKKYRRSSVSRAFWRRVGEDRSAPRALRLLQENRNRRYVRITIREAEEMLRCCLLWKECPPSGIPFYFESLEDKGGKRKPRKA